LAKKLYVEGTKGKILYPVTVGQKKIGNRTFTITEVPEKMKYGNIGITSVAAKETLPGPVKTNIPYGTMILWSGQSPRTRTSTIWHEGIEPYCMRYGKLPYRIAHKISLRFENTKVTPREALLWYRTNLHRLGSSWHVRKSK
jgi:hypothetical protein